MNARGLLWPSAFLAALRETALLSVTVGGSDYYPPGPPHSARHQCYSRATAAASQPWRPQPEGAEAASPANKGLRIEVAGRARKLF